jgi:hypothetical protein
MGIWQNVFDLSGFDGTFWPRRQLVVIFRLNIAILGLIEKNIRINDYFLRSILITFSTSIGQKIRSSHA